MTVMTFCKKYNYTQKPYGVSVSPYTKSKQELLALARKKTPMSQSIGGLINDIVVFGIFVYLILLLTGRVKMRGDKQEKLDDLIRRKGTLLKFLAYGGAVIFAALILIGIFSFKPADKRSYAATQNNHPWTKDEKIAMTNACILNAKVSYQKDSVKTRALCECATESITSKYTYEQAMELNKQPREEQLKVVIPVLKACQVEVNGAK
jgi:hypothetical protein